MEEKLDARLCEKIMETSPVIIFVLNKNGDIEYINKWGRHFIPFIKNIDFFNKPQTFESEFRVGGEIRIIKWWCRKEMDKKTLVAGVDITHRRRLERALAILRRVNHAILKAKSKKTMLEEVCKIIVESGYSSAWIGLTESTSQEIVPIARAGEIDDLNNIENIIKGKQQSVKGNIYRGNRIIIRKWENGNIALFPIIYKEEIFGVLGIFAKEKNAFSEEELNILGEIASDIAQGIAIIRLAEIKRRAFYQLERNIKQFRALVDKIRNPVAVIQGYSELYSPDFQKKIEKQLTQIMSSLSILEKEWLSTEDLKKTFFEKESPPRKSSKTVLVVDDDEALRKVIELMLSDKYKVLSAKNGEEAVKLYKEHRPDIVLMDILMPQMDGITATKKIKEIDENAKIIGITAYAKQKKKEMLDAGVIMVLEKPFKKSRLLQIIENALGPP